VAVLDADKEGFLRARTSLVQTCGRAARNAEGKVIFYADRITDSMRACMDEVSRRREVQVAWNEERGITPQTVIKPIRESLEALYEMDYAEIPEVAGTERRGAKDDDDPSGWDRKRLDAELERVRGSMLEAAGELRFEDAARMRDRLKTLEAVALRR
jgi:excinuclease ABC subunit B